MRNQPNSKRGKGKPIRAGAIGKNVSSFTKKLGGSKTVGKVASGTAKRSARYSGARLPTSIRR